jgi:hypothetical protein
MDDATVPRPPHPNEARPRNGKEMPQAPIKKATSTDIFPGLLLNMIVSLRIWAGSSARSDSASTTTASIHQSSTSDLLLQSPTEPRIMKFGAPALSIARPSPAYTRLWTPNVLPPS